MPDKHWDLLVTELEGVEPQKPESLGGVDFVLIARYLAGDCDPREREQVEEAARCSPEVSECIALARQALGGEPAEPIPAADPRPRPAAGRNPRSRRFARALWNCGVAASLLAILAGGAYLVWRLSPWPADDDRGEGLLASVKEKSAEDIAKLPFKSGRSPADEREGENIELLRTAELLANTGAQIRPRIVAAVLAEPRAEPRPRAAEIPGNSLEETRRAVKGLETTVAGLGKQVDELGKQFGSFRNGPEPRLAGVRPGPAEATSQGPVGPHDNLDRLEDEVRKVAKDVEALRRQCGGCQTVAPERAVACCDLCAPRSACAPRPACLPAPCSGDCAGCQAFMLGQPATRLSMAPCPLDGCTVVAIEGVVPPAPACPLVRAGPVRAAATAVASEDRRRRALPPERPGAGPPCASAGRFVPGLPAGGPPADLVPVVRAAGAQDYAVLRPALPPDGTDMVPVVRPDRPPTGPRKIEDKPPPAPEPRPVDATWLSGRPGMAPPLTP
jgi:hypothetical protein